VSRALRITAVTLLAAGGLSAQEFQPPHPRPAGKGTDLGLYGFGVRGGGELVGSAALVGGIALDLGNLFSDRVRLRPSVEVGLQSPRSYVASFEALFRFTGDGESVIPYLGGGLSLAGHDGCGSDSQCPDLWIDVALGFEVRFRSTFNWLVEYRALDLLRRHRVYLGLTTRRGG
jgi:hypothetical protein